MAPKRHVCKISIKWKQSPKYRMAPKQRRFRSRINQKRYREKRKEKNEQNAAIVAYVEEYFPWVIEAFRIQKQKVIINNAIFFFYFVLTNCLFSPLWKTTLHWKLLKTTLHWKLLKTRLCQKLLKTIPPWKLNQLRWKVF